MKKLIFLVLVATAAVTANAQVDTTNAASQSSQYSTQDRTEYTDKESISATDLPELVKESLKSPDYAGWNTSNIWKKEKDGKTFYAVELKNATETKIVKFDAQGNKVKEKTKR